MRPAACVFVALFACKHPGASTSVEASAPSATASAIAVTNARCATSCDAGFCWDQCPTRWIAPRGSVFAVDVAEESVAWADKGGAHWWRRGGERSDFPAGGAPVAVRGERLVFGNANNTVSLVRGHDAPRIVKLPHCEESSDAIIGADRIAFRCSRAVTDNSGGPGLGAIRSMLTDFTVTDGDGKVLGTEEFSKSPRVDSMNTVFVLRGERVITNDNERLVELDLVTKKPLMKVLGSLPVGYVVGGGVEHGAGFDLVAWNCADHVVESCSAEVVATLVHVEGRRIEPHTLPTSELFSSLPTHGDARVVRSDHGLYREVAGKLDALVRGTKDLLYAAVAADGTSVTVTEDGIVVRARSAW